MLRPKRRIATRYRVLAQPWGNRDVSQSLRLTQAEEALHNLVTGNMARVVVDQNGDRVEYTMTNAAELRAYIAMLRAGPGQVNRPLGFVF